jgi:hypothetical protein
MIKRLLFASSVILASPMLAGPASAGPNWTAIGKAELPSYGNAQLFIDPTPRPNGQMLSGQLRAVLDEPWNDPIVPGSYRDIYFRVLADCGARTIAIMPTWPEGPDKTSVPLQNLKRPVPGSADAMLLHAYCGG